MIFLSLYFLQRIELHQQVPDLPAPVSDKNCVFQKNKTKQNKTLSETPFNPPLLAFYLYGEVSVFLFL